MSPRAAARALRGSGAAGARGPPARGAAAGASWSRRGPACPPITGSADTAGPAATSRPRSGLCPTARTRCPPTPATSSRPSAPRCRCTGARSSRGPRPTAARPGGRRWGAAGTRRARATAPRTTRGTGWATAACLGSGTSLRGLPHLLQSY